ncbi:MAG: putative DNA binding domain-containing protein [Candidatus Zambryskibacteria bacterium]|nr:putative DNA binding domain-containing protein [Candidatus Zambryskibacteria bacterium]
MNRIIIKQGPIAFLKDVFLMEIVAIIFLFTISFLANYEMLFIGLSLDHYIGYHTFVLVAASLFQLIYLVALFINWYFSYFEIGEREIVRKFGILFHHKKYVSLTDIISVETYQSPIDRRINHATITLEHRDGKITKIKDIPNFEEYTDIIKQTIQNLSGNTSFPNIKTLLRQGERHDSEFKETLRFDIRKNEVNKELEKAIIKSIVGFLNAGGGTLLIGVSDDRTVVGLENDYKTLPKKNRDGFENHLTMLIKTMIGLPFTKYIKISFGEVSEKDICVVSVQNGHKPAYLKNGDKKEEFYARIGNSTQPFSMSETEEYIKTHFKR